VPSVDQLTNQRRHMECACYFEGRKGKRRQQLAHQEVDEVTFPCRAC